MGVGAWLTSRHLQVWDCVFFVVAQYRYEVCNVSWGWLLPAALSTAAAIQTPRMARAQCAGKAQTRAADAWQTQQHGRLRRGFWFLGAFGRWVPLPLGRLSKMLAAAWPGIPSMARSPQRLLPGASVQARRACMLPSTAGPAAGQRSGPAGCLPAGWHILKPPAARSAQASAMLSDLGLTGVS